VSRAGCEGPASHREFVPLVVIDGNAKRAERLDQSKQPLDVPNAAV